MILFRGLAYLLSAIIVASFIHGIASRVLTLDSAQGKRRLRSSGSGFAFSWPYSEDGGCRCERQGWGQYKTETECLSAMAASPFEGCTYRREGIEVSDCKYVVSTSTFVRNAACKDLCETGLSGSSQDWSHFLDHCQFEKYSVTSAGQVKLASNGCFSNKIFGHSDRSVSVPNADIAYIGYAAVDSPSECQDFCQGWEECDNWFWRGSLEEDKRVSSFSSANLAAPGISAPNSSTDVKFWETNYTCFLKKNSTVLAAEQAVLPVGKLAAGLEIDPTDELRKICDVTEKWDAILNQHQNAALDDVCHCGCVWNSLKHVSGPRYCHQSNEPFFH